MDKIQKIDLEIQELKNKMKDPLKYDCPFKWNGIDNGKGWPLTTRSERITGYFRDVATNMPPDMYGNTGNANPGKNMEINVDRKRYVVS
jgi:hypothetical protein